MRGLLLATLLICGACAPQAASPTPIGTPTPTESLVPSASPAPTTAAIASPTIEPTTLPTIEPTTQPTAEPSTGPGPSLPCPTARLLNVRQYVEASFQCFAGKDVRIKGWLDGPPPLGFEGPATYPLWLAYPESGPCAPPAEGCSVTIAMWQDVPLDPDRICSDADAYCSFFFPHSAPGTGLHFLPLRRWVILTGHTDDPAAQRCHYEYQPGEDPVFDDAQAVEHCRTQFVVTEIDVVDSP